MRSEFEKDPKVKELIEQGCSFDSTDNRYKAEDVSRIIEITVLNARWETFQFQQSKVDELKASHHGEIIGHTHHLSKVKKDRDELQKQKSLQEIEINQIAQANQQWQLKCNDLQKRVDAVKQLIKDYKDPSITSDKSFQHGLLLVADELEQALKGGL